VLKQRLITIKQKNGFSSTARQHLDERHSRIVTAALEVFSEYSFRDATTDEIARRAKVSKRDIYSKFARKHDLLAAVIDTVLQADEENFINVISLTAEFTSLQERLEVIGLALVNEILSPATGFISRIISSESIDQPEIGAIYFKTWYIRRGDLISQVLSSHMGQTGKRTQRMQEATQAARQFVALITHLPQLSVMVSMRDMWTSKSVQSHVKSSVVCFLKAHPITA
jgi:AcrR family transcriptional regulator